MFTFFIPSFTEKKVEKNNFTELLKPIDFAALRKMQERKSVEPRLFDLLFKEKDIQNHIQAANQVESLNSKVG